MRIDELETPALLIEQPVLNANIERMADYCRAHQISLRVDVSCHRAPMIAYKQIAAGACGIACQTLGEVQGFADAGFCDIRISRSALDRAELESLLNLAERLEVQLTVDSLAAVNDISRLSERIGSKTPLLIEINANENRNQPKTSLKTLEIARQIVVFPSVQFAGIVINSAAPIASAYVIETLNRFEAAGVFVPMVSCASAGRHFQTHEAPRITELCVGAYALYDYSHVCRSECAFADCALAVLTTVIDTPSRNLAILDAGAQTFNTALSACAEKLPASSRALVGGETEKVFGVAKNCPSCDLSAIFTGEYGHLSMGDNQFSVGEKALIIPAYAESTIGAHDTFAFFQGNRVLEILPIL